MVRVLELGFQVAGGSEGIKVHCRDSLEVTEDSSSEVAGKSPASKGTNLCSNEDEEAEEWHNGNFVNNGEMERGCIDGRSLGEEELAGSAQQAFMSDQNGGQNEIYNAENNGSVQVSKKDGAVEKVERASSQQTTSLNAVPSFYDHKGYANEKWGLGDKNVDSMAATFISNVRHRFKLDVVDN
ncbi:hypothetical protein V6N13_110244 [Hibiscus sabdariffa]